MQTRRIININDKTEYSWRQAHALYLDQLGVMYYELLQPNEIPITGECYQPLKQKRPDYAKRHYKVIFQHGNVTCCEIGQGNVRNA